MTDLDDLMSRIEEINAKEPPELTNSDIATLIDYHRKQRARRMAGEKPAKPKSTGLDISNITNKLIKASKPAIKVDRRF